MTIPILIECIDGDPKRADGFIFRQERGTSEGSSWLPVGIVRLEELEAVQTFEAPGPINTPLGTVSQRDRAILRVMSLLIQAVQTGDSQALNKYVDLKAAGEASAAARRIRGSLDLDSRGVPVRGATNRPESAFSAWLDPTTLGVFQEMGLALERERQENLLQKQVQARVKKPGHPIAELIRELNSLVGAKLVLWWQVKERKLASGLLCRNFSSALFALLLSRAVLPEGTGICARCGKVFTRVRVGQKFCSKRCGFSVRKARQRARRKGKPA